MEGALVPFLLWPFSSEATTGVLRSRRLLGIAAAISSFAVIEVASDFISQNPERRPEKPGDFTIRIFPGWPRFGSVRLRFAHGTVRAVPVFGSDGSCAERVFCALQHSLRGWHGSGSGFGFLRNGADGSGSDFGSWKNGSDGSGFQFQFGSCAILYSC